MKATLQTLYSKKLSWKSKQKNALQGAYLFSEQGFPCIGFEKLCFNYRVFPALVTTFNCFVTFFPCLINFFSLFTLQGFPCFSKNSYLQGLICIGYKFFMFQLQGFPCFNSTFSLFWLRYFPVSLKKNPCLIYRVFPVLQKI